MIQVVIFIAQLALAGLILSFEQVFGLPIIFLMVSLYYSTFYSERFRLLLLVVCGVLLAGFYQLPFAVGVGLMMAANLIYQVTGKRLHQVGTRLLVSSLGGSLGVMVAAAVVVSAGLVISSIISLVAALLVGRWLFSSHHGSVYRR